MKIRNKKFLIGLCLTLFTGCEFKKDENLSNNSNIESLGESKSKTTFNQDQFTFSRDLNLDDDLFISARNVVFRPDSKVILNRYNMRIEAETVTFGEGSSLVGYEKRDYAECRTHGHSSGSIEIQTNILEGSVYLELVGQHAGQSSSYHKDDAIYGPLRNEDELFVGYPYYNSKCHLIGEYLDTAENFKRNGGKSGWLDIIAQDYSNFDFKISSRFSHGSYRSVWDYKSGNVGAIRYISRGLDGDKSRVCFLIDDEFLCQVGEE